MPNEPIELPAFPAVKVTDYFKPTSLTWLSATGLIGLGVYLLTQGDLEGGIKAILAGLAAVGLRRAVGGP